MPDTWMPFETRPDAMPLFVLTHGAKVAKDGERLAITLPEAALAAEFAQAPPPARMVRLGEVSHLVLIGNVGITTPCLHMLMRSGIPVAWLDGRGWYLGRTVGCPDGEAAARRAQYRTVEDPARRLEIARRLVAAKIINCRSRFRHRGLVAGLGLERGPTGDVPRRLKQLALNAAGAGSREALFGIEGAAAALYFSAFSNLIRSPRSADAKAFRFERRTRRPPRDPVSALLSYAYGVLTRTMVMAVATEGLDVQVGFLHDTWRGRPSLALDLMEPFRPLIADGAVLEAINTGAVSAEDFAPAQEQDGVGDCSDGDGGAGPARPQGLALSQTARRVLVQGMERRLDRGLNAGSPTPALTYRGAMVRQAAQLSRFLREEADVFEVFQAA